MKRAFSLVELSIVLVILGLLVGGVLSGQSLIRASELRAVTSEYARYLTASQTFRDKYFALPGDFKDATRFWGRLNGNADCVTNSAAGVVSTGACDGNADGIINQAGAASQAGEFAQLWRQLALAGLIEGSYSGLAGANGAQHCVVGTDCPKSKMNNAGWGFLYVGLYGDANIFTLNYGNTFTFGAPHPSYLPANPALKPEEAWNIDTKMDDGKPASGKVIATLWNNLCSKPDDNATYTSTNLASSYNLSSNVLQCALYFRQVF